MSTPEHRLSALGIVLPAVTRPVAAYANGVCVDGMVYLSGKGPLAPDGTWGRGVVGDDVTVAEAREHARITGLHLLAVARDMLGSLDRVRQVVKLLGMVRSGPDFERHPEVIDGCSVLLADVFGQAGVHARSAVGVTSLPFGITVEIEAILAVRP